MRYFWSGESRAKITPILANLAKSSSLTPLSCSPVTICSSLNSIPASLEMLLVTIQPSPLITLSFIPSSINFLIAETVVNLSGSRKRSIPKTVRLVSSEGFEFLFADSRYATAITRKPRISYVSTVSINFAFLALSSLYFLAPISSWVETFNTASAPPFTINIRFPSVATETLILCRS